ncbi:TetR/AcrR family transcriptional regulator [Sediminicoccus sp. KRV36]|uniref:TetR/AcrR family transcriptional regulator n=1 Tax=Sediminicoccus sp. KRV36 TaxID=3133721 RepID=UPI00200E036A|nr:TetR/AcrR family transcriptional regulator [Sediminicoccus rosea]UPY37171.1 TetR/AcrR family transcriptional regulator [Sediminicoccus rosea]
MPEAPPIPDARTRILDAAERIVQAKGVPALTLEAAAREAGISKGGLLYHFASKEAMLSGLVARLAEYVQMDFDAVLAAQSGPCPASRAVLAWAFDHPEQVCEEQHRAGAVFLAVFHHDPAMLGPIRAVFAHIRDRLRADALPPGHALAIMAASDGLFFGALFGMYEQSEAERLAIRTALEGLLGEAGA